MEQLFLLLSSIHPLSPELALHLSAILKAMEIKRGDYLLKEGKVCKNVWFIDKGLLRCYYQKESKEVSNWFMKEGDVIFSVESFYRQAASYETVEAIDNTMVYYITYDELQHIYRTYSEFNFIGRVLTEQYYMQCERRLREIRMQTASERYALLENEHPEYIKRIAAKHLASYLGISEETYSRIRAGRWRQ